MCSVCAKTKRLSLGDALNLVGEELANGREDREHLESLLEQLLGDGEEPEEDQELAAEWERYRHES